MLEQSSHPKDKVFKAHIPGLYEDRYGWFQEGKDALYLQAYEAFPIERLTDIRALGFLSPLAGFHDALYPIVKVEFEGFSHTRASHSFHVARTTELILRENGASEQQIKMGIVAGLLHDIATPAGGDAIKALDKPSLDEEDHWMDVLDERGFEFIKDQGVGLDGLDDAIHNRGLIGEVLDIADRIAYTYADSYHLGKYASGTIAEYLYQHVRINHDTEQVYFDSFYGLNDFLTLRAFNHFQLYLHPENRGGDMMIRRLVAPLYGEDGSKPLTPQKLREMKNRDLFDLLGETYETFPPQLEESLVNLHPSYQPCEDADGIAVRTKALKKDPNIVIVGSEEIPKFNPGTDYLVQDPFTGKVLPLAEFDGSAAFVLKRYSTMQAIPYCLYYFDTSQGGTLTATLKTLLEAS